MPLVPAVTDINQLKDRLEVARLLEWSASAVAGAKYDRNELTIWIDRAHLIGAMTFLRDDSQLRFNLLCDVTCVDWYPSEPRFEVVYELRSIPRNKRVRVKVKLTSDDARIQSVINVWPSSNFFEREVFDLFGVYFEGHPYLRRIMMPEDWEGHPMRKDYPVEGYR
jgi:NADH-quinone oxidoreductase subunit C